MRRPSFHAGRLPRPWHRSVSVRQRDRTRRLHLMATSSLAGYARSAPVGGCRDSVSRSKTSIRQGFGIAGLHALPRRSPRRVAQAPDGSASPFLRASCAGQSPKDGSVRSARSGPTTLPRNTPASGRTRPGWMDGGHAIRARPRWPCRSGPSRRRMNRDIRQASTPSPASPRHCSFDIRGGRGRAAEVELDRSMWLLPPRFCG